MRRSYFTMLMVFILGLPSLSAQKLSRAEKRIIASVEKNNAGAISFLEKVVNINSGTLNAAGVKEVGAVFGEAFENIGFETRWIDMPAEMNRAGHLFAETRGSKGKRLLLIGHLDTVFEEDSPFQKFERVNDSIAKAPGGNDMKGGNVIVLYALKALHENGLLKNAQIIVAFTGDEESTGKPLKISRKDLIEAAKQSDIALGFETSTGFNYATVARRGASGWSLEVEGKRAHSSGVFSERVGAGAIFEMSRILHRFYTEVKGEELLTFNPGILMGGTFIDFDTKTSKGDVFGKGNVVAQKAIARGGLRFISEEQKERARNKMREIVAESLPNTSAVISFTDSYPAMEPTEGNKRLMAQLNEVSLDLGQGEVLPYDPGKRGAADVSFVAEYVDCLDGLGTMGTGAHTPEETVNLSTIEDLTKRIAILIYRLIDQ
ncbi:M20/M25/M40 family metallo-hydrolase [Allomuricauda sp. SCSIO 65647]|uniref:M20/M25/M40 family metallo-hydrolase n=1 Tax=Allomuricauda sp. SCSIO 65647 TaxID=2908843 RepID=UPI001F3F6F54|nr:M20/M25/M40 family metallo-hydrolase [Muricauda sp. SCSIO 65647]UJH66656.1 M20/M25/M40 family metallo-hydrolase [Muricauda sp. SCSIO 65647]